MNIIVEINSIAMNKLKNSNDDFIKYDIDVALDEVENKESGIMLKYKIGLLSNPTNTKMTIEGFASLCGNESEISKQLEPYQKNIPLVVNVIYQEIFPLIYVLSKSLQIPCPAYKLSQISSTIPQEVKPVEVSNESTPSEQVTEKTTELVEEIKTEHAKVFPPTENEPVIQEANVSSI
jgi:hypothetical protein